MLVNCQAPTIVNSSTPGQDDQFLELLLCDAALEVQPS